MLVAVGVDVSGNVVSVLVGLGWTVDVGLLTVGREKISVAVGRAVGSSPSGVFDVDWQLNRKNINPTNSQLRLNLLEILQRMGHSPSAA